MLPLITGSWRVAASLVVVLLPIWSAMALRSTTPRRLSPRVNTLELAAASKATLDKDTTWRLRLVIRGIKTEQGKKIDELFSLDAHFVEDEGYEPPQGSIETVSSNPDARLKILDSRWKLSEDPNERKDGLWVWGLFKEPLYPYMLLQLRTDAIELPGNTSNEKTDRIPPLQLFAQINHWRDKELGVILDTTELKTRQAERVKADLFGAAEADIYSDTEVGTLSIQPLPSQSNV